MSELSYWVWLNELGLNPYRARQVLDHFGGPKAAFFAEKVDFSDVPGLNAKEIAALCNKELRNVHRIAEDMQALGGRILTQQDAEYPQRLRNMPDPPVLLYLRGNLPSVDDEAAVVIAGTRDCSPYGIAAAARIASEITRHGGLVVSGLAEGIDAAAAQGAVNEGGAVIGVLGCGVERVYPAKNKALFESVLETGALVSEYPPGSEPLGRHFPQRNRIMTGLSVALVAVEIPKETSGVMHSVRHAEEQGREVFVVPANIDSPTSRVSNALLSEGCQSAATGWEVLRDFSHLFPSLKEEIEPLKQVAPVPSDVSPQIPAESKEQAKKILDKPEERLYIDLEVIMETCSESEQAVLKCLRADPRHVDEIVAQSALPVQKVNVCLTTLGIAGHIREHPGKRYSLELKS